MYGCLSRRALGGAGKLPPRCVATRARPGSSAPARSSRDADHGGPPRLAPWPGPRAPRVPARALPPSRALTSFSDDIRGYGVTDDESAAPSPSDSAANSSPPSPPPLVSVPHLVALLLDLNDEGQRVIRAVTARGSLGTRDKGGRDDVTGEYVVDAQTEADRAVEAHVLRALRAFCPDLAVVAEESYENALRLDPCGNDPDDLTSESDARDDDDDDSCPWLPTLAPFAPRGTVVPRTAPAKLALDPTATEWPPHLARPIDASRVAVYVDPLDGTNEFASGERTAVTCLMGVAVDGSPVAGIIGQPFFDRGVGSMGRVVWGGRGVGVRGLENPEEEEEEGEGRAARKKSASASATLLPPAAAPTSPPLLCVNRVTRDRRIGAVLEATNATVGFEVSATGFHFLKVLSGDATHSALTRSGTKKWDSCAGEALIRAVGGVVSDAVGRRYDYTPGPPRGGPAADGVQNLCGLLVSRDPDAHLAFAANARRAMAPLGRWPFDVADPSVRPRTLPAPPPGGYRVLTVDVGGCLLTPKEPVVETYARIARARGLPAGDGDAIVRAIRDGFASPIPASNPPGVRYVGDGRGFWRPLVANAMGGLALDDPRLEPALDDLYEHYERASSWHVAPGAIRALKRARGAGVKTAVVSNWDERLPGLLRACGFDEEALDAVVVSAEVLADKPDRRIFEAALEALGVGAEDKRGCVHVGDSVVNDVRGAVGAGFGAALLWSPEMREGCTFDFEEVADEIIEGRMRSGA